MTGWFGQAKSHVLVRLFGLLISRPHSLSACRQGGEGGGGDLGEEAAGALQDLVLDDEEAGDVHEVLSVALQHAGRRGEVTGQLQVALLEVVLPERLHAPPSSWVAWLRRRRGCVRPEPSATVQDRPGERLGAHLHVTEHVLHMQAAVEAAHVDVLQQRQRVGCLVRVHRAARAHAGLLEPLFRACTPHQHARVKGAIQASIAFTHGACAIPGPENEVIQSRVAQALHAPMAQVCRSRQRVGGVRAVVSAVVQASYHTRGITPEKVGSAKSAGISAADAFCLMELRPYAGSSWAMKCSTSALALLRSLSWISIPTPRRALTVSWVTAACMPW